MADDPRTMDIINPELRGMPQHEYLQELNHRTYKAGHTTREGGPIPPKIMTSVSFGKTAMPKVWPRDKDGNLIDD